MLPTPHFKNIASHCIDNLEVVSPQPEYLEEFLLGAGLEEPEDP